MFIDASALVAILLREPEEDEFAARIQRADKRVLSPLAAWETAVALTRGLHLKAETSTEMVGRYLGEFGIDLVPVPPEAFPIAMYAFDRYGKGRHPAALNFGDCFAYACAKHLKMPLLYKGDDFALTDIRAA